MSPSSKSGPKPITILYFAALRTHLSLERESIPLPSSSFSVGSISLLQLKALILERHSDERTKAILENCMWSVGDEMVDMPESTDTEEMDDGHGVRLKGGEVVGVIPPVSGG